jgi:hypothetical protein
MRSAAHLIDLLLTPSAKGNFDQEVIGSQTLKGQGASEIAQRTGDGGPGSYEPAMRFEQFVLIIEVETEVKTSWIMQSFIRWYRTQRKRQTVFVKKNGEAILALKNAAKAEVPFEKCPNPGDVFDRKVDVVKLHGCLHLQALIWLAGAT